MKTLITKTLSILIAKEKQQLRLQILLNLLISIADILFLGLFVVLVNYYTNPTGRTLSFIVAILGKHGAIIQLAFFTLLFCIKNLAGYYITRQQFHFIYKVAHRISTDCLNQYLSMPYQQYVAADKSAWQRKISQQPIEFAHYLLNGIQLLFTEVVISLLVIAGILIVNARLFLILLIVLAPPVILLSFVTRSKLKDARSNIKTASEKALLFLHEGLSGYTESKVYDKQSFFVNRYQAQQSSLNKYLSRLQTIQALPSRITEIFAIAGLLVIILLNRFYNGYAATTIIEIGAFSAAAYKLLPGIVRIYNITGQMKSYAFAIDGLPQNATVLTHPANLGQIHSISLHNVRFNYSEKQIFNNLNIGFNAGSFTAVTGASGIGKTSLFHLITGFNEASEGIIKVNNIEVSSTQLTQLLPSIAYVPQQSFFIRDTVRNNIILGDEHPDEAALDEVLRITGIHSMFNTPGNAANTLVYEDGKNISGGQRQRIAIARALYKTAASVILLDEPFNELDETAEKHLMYHFRKLADSGKIIILIMHNKAHISLCTNHIKIV